MTREVIMYIIFMKKLLFIHWNIIRDNGNYIVLPCQDLHFSLLKRYGSLFDEVLVILHIDNIHDIVSIHSCKVDFDKIFKNKVHFKVEKNTPNCDNTTFEKYFLPIVNKVPNEYSVVYYIHNKGITHDFTVSMKLWIASLYYYNFERFNEHCQYLEDDTVVVGGPMFVGQLDISNYNTVRFSNNSEPFSINWHFTGSFYGISPNNLFLYCKKENIEIPHRINGNVEMHFPSFVKKEFVKTDSLCKEIALIKDENGHLLPEINPYLIFSNLIQDNDMIDIDTINALVKNDKS